MDVLDSGNLSHKVVSVAAGEAHTLVLTGDGCVYSWGRGMFGRLGTGLESDEDVPVRVQMGDDRRKLKFVGVAAGAYHSLALADDGSLWCWGYNSYGQLGFGEEKSIMPRFLELPSPESLQDEPEREGERERETPIRFCAVKAGGMMSLAIDIRGMLWMWGNCPSQNDNDDVFSLQSNITPIPVRGLFGHSVVKVACGNEHVVAFVSTGEMYSWGSNKYGQLGLGDKKSRPHPAIIKEFGLESTWEVYELACGAFHTAFLAHKNLANDKLKSSSTCWTFGLGDNGQLGHGTTQSLLYPKLVTKLKHDDYFVSVDCGLFHTSVVSSAGDIWSWGMEKGLGLCPDASFTGNDAGDAVSPRLIADDYQVPVQIACGAAHTVLVTQDGYKVWSWGRGESGVLGNGMSVDCYAPTLVRWPPLVDELETTTEIADESSLSLAKEEIKQLESRLSIMERYASILHGSIFGRPFEEQDIPVSLQDSETFDIAKEWNSMLESADRNKLVGLEMFYRNMLAGVKDKLIKRRIQEIVKECLNSSTSKTP